MELRVLHSTSSETGERAFDPLSPGVAPQAMRLEARTSPNHDRDEGDGEETSAALPPREQPPLGCCSNCIISTALACILCRRKCDAGSVISEFAFFPPKPPTYWLKLGDGADCTAIEYIYPELQLDEAFAKLQKTDGREGRGSCRVLTTSRSEQVPSFYFHVEDAYFCVVYMHANATDCGGMLPTYARLSERLRVSVVAVEYSGYGAASGKPSVLNCHADADAASAEATRRGYPPDRQVLYGQSVGSGPACRLAARVFPASSSDGSNNSTTVRGLVLHAPIASGIRALTAAGCCSPVNLFSCLDPFNNLREMSQIRCPVYIMHGTEDDEIPCAHGHMLHAAAWQPHPPFWVRGAGHNNLAETARDEYFTRLEAFLNTLRGTVTGPQASH